MSPLSELFDTLNIEHLLYLGNKKVKELRKEEQVIYQYVYKDVVIDENAIVSDSINRINCSGYIYHKPLNEIANCILSDFGCTCDCTCNDFSDCTCDEEAENEVEDLKSKLESHRLGLGLKILYFYDAKTKILDYFAGEKFTVRGYHVSEDAGESLILLEGKNHSFHAKEGKINLNIDDLKYLGEIGLVSSKITKPMPDDLVKLGFDEIYDRLAQFAEKINNIKPTEQQEVT